jgi:hypothetical protein
MPRTALLPIYFNVVWDVVFTKGIPMTADATVQGSKHSTLMYW